MDPEPLASVYPWYPVPTMISLYTLLIEVIRALYACVAVTVCPRNCISNPRAFRAVAYGLSQRRQIYEKKTQAPRRPQYPSPLSFLPKRCCCSEQPVDGDILKITFNSIVTDFQAINVVQRNSSDSKLAKSDFTNLNVGVVVSMDSWGRFKTLK